MEYNLDCPKIPFENLKLSKRESSGFNLLTNSNDDININELYKTTIEISNEKLISLKKEYLLELIKFINSNCHIILENEKFINFTFSIFKIIKSINNNGYNIIIQNDNNKIIGDNIFYKKKEENSINIINENIEIKNKNIEVKHNFIPPILCSIHELKFQNLDDYLYHCYLNHNKFLCEECSQNFSNFLDFKKHINLMKNQNINNININSINPRNENLINIQDENKIKCTECNLKFDSVENMTIHFFEKHENKKIQDNLKKQEELKRQEEEMRKEELERLKRKEEVMKYEELKRKEKLKEEDQKNEIEQLQEEDFGNQNDNNYICYIDKQSFPSEKLYVEHFQKEHSDDYPFYCDICKKGFLHEEDKNKHDNAKHSNNNNRNNSNIHCWCKVCGREFSSKQLMNKHIKDQKHSLDNYPYYCRICPYRFSSKNELYDHIKYYNHYSCICKKCQKKFLTKHALEAHCKDKNH